MKTATTLSRRAWICIATCFLCAGVCWSAGNIDSADRYAWASHAGWLNFSPAHGGVTVVKDGANGYLKGYVWAENVGWVKLGAGDGDGPYANTSASNWGVNMDAAGNLSGYGWSSHVGWINFHPTHGQATISPVTGDFDGFAWGENIGWVHFKNASPQYNVQLILHTLTYHAGPGGSIDGAPSITQTVELGGNGSTVSAAANAGYYFVAWSDGVLTASRMDTNVTGDTSVTALFERDRGTVAVSVTPNTASWSFTDGDSVVHTGTGTQTVANIPTGQITLIWNPLNNYGAPPNPPPQNLQKGATITFTGAYTRQMGTVIVNVTPAAAASATWSFKDGDGASHNGMGNASIPGIPTGLVYFTWGPLYRHDKPPAPSPEWLTTGASVTFNGTYTRRTGTVVVHVTPDTASWWFTDGDQERHDGTGDAEVKQVPTGNITLTWEMLPGYSFPSPGYDTKDLAKDGTTTFSAIYERITAADQWELF